MDFIELVLKQVSITGKFTCSDAFLQSLSRKQVRLSCEKKTTEYAEKVANDYNLILTVERVLDRHKGLKGIVYTFKTK